MSLRTLGKDNPKNSLRIFNSFELDKELPKFREVIEKVEAEEKAKAEASAQSSDPSVNPNVMPTISINESTGGFTVSHNVITTPQFETGGWEGEASMSDSHIRGKKRWLPEWVRFWDRPVKPTPEVPVSEVFNLVLTTPEELAEFNERTSQYEKLIKEAQEAHQTRLVELLREQKAIRLFENALYALGFKKYLTEAQLMKFVENCEKGLCLDWISYFTRPIPKEVIAAKLKCDKAHLFDNYVVLHFDPDDKATTEKDRARERDPILFGVIKASRKLYFVGDWKDELCDLTLEQIAESLESDLEMSKEVRVDRT